MQAYKLSGIITLVALSFFAACAPTDHGASGSSPAPVAAPTPAAKPVVPVKPASVIATPQHKPTPATASAASVAPKKRVMGWVEYVHLTSTGGDRAKAKLDSGAKVTSLNAKIIKTFKRDKKRYVLFRVVLDDESVETLERRIIRYVRIKTKNGGFIRRPVVEMSICLGDQHLVGEVNLADRDHFIYPILIGRNMLKDDFLIDASRRLTSKPSCKKKG